jgi:hypothetical protein
VTGDPYFGRPWGAAALDGATRVPTPVGDECLRCRELIAADDQGWIRVAVTRMDDSGDLVGCSKPIHVECDFIGVAGHLFGVCACTGFDTSTRHAARVAWRNSVDLRYGREGPCAE